jgi:hypothetical protein
MQLATLDATELREALKAYIECALWASTGEDGEPLDAGYDATDLAEESRVSMREDLWDFIELVQEQGIDASDWSADQFGHDFWLTRNGHGAGFWDRGHEAGSELTKWAKTFGTSDLYVGDNGKLYVS